MARTRTFVAVKIPPEAAGRLQDLIRALSEGVEGVKWVAADKLHITLKFLGDVEDTDLHDVCTSVAGATGGFGTFEVVLVGAGAFPNNRRPRTVWAGASQEEPLVRLQKAVDRALRDLGYARETRKFVPHVTLGRIRLGNPTLARLSEHLLRHAATELGVLPVDEVLVLSSDLRPDGPEYNVLSRVPLSPGPPYENSS